MSKLTDKIWAFSEPIVRESGCEIWDIEYIKEASQWYLRIYIDKAEGGVFIADCEKISRAVDEILEEQDLISESYIFEVSSAGAERQLKRPSDFERFMNSKVEVKLYKPLNGTKVYEGTLVSYDNGDVTIEMPDGAVTFQKAQVAKVGLRVM